MKSRSRKSLTPRIFKELNHYLTDYGMSEGRAFLWPLSDILFSARGSLIYSLSVITIITAIKNPTGRGLWKLSEKFENISFSFFLHQQDIGQEFIVHYLADCGMSQG